ncbi:alpha-1,2-fucosyltransferase [bacterium]|nr:alpha-1,2-fucosyltransferase [bacterium]
MNKKKHSQYQIISLGQACLTRAFLTWENLIPTKKMGRESMVFDLARYKLFSVIELIKNDFADFFEDYEIKFIQRDASTTWHSKKYNIDFTHDNDIINDFEKFRSRYEKRINNFNEAFNSDTFTYFIHYIEQGEENLRENIINLNNVIKEKRGKKPFKLIIWNLSGNDLNNIQDVDIINSQKTVDENTDWWNRSFWTKENLNWRKEIALQTEALIKNHFNIEHFEDPLFERIYQNNIKPLLKQIFQINNHPRENRKVLTLFGKDFTIKKIRPYNEEIIISFDGRMANQMFQWALARAFEQKYDKLPIIDDSTETIKLNNFKMISAIKTVDKSLIYKICKMIPLHNLRNKLTKMNFKISVVNEELGKYCENILDTTPPANLKGFFQNEKYFINVREQLLKDFQLNEDLDEQNREMLKKIKNTESISVHFRRGDYTKARIAKVFGCCGENYYKNAIKIIAEKLDKKPTLFIFSDDINWVKNNIKFEYETIFVDINSGKKGYFDLELMKNCKHNVIANSSFSWWSAWLNENPDKIVVAPRPWICTRTKENDFETVPESWIKCDADFG